VTAGSAASVCARAGNAGTQSKAAHLSSTRRRNMFGIILIDLSRASIDA
jgi:hypothetical protein